ncbi:hypothetical protein [Rhodoferax sp.]|uniref:hypothetical protein n=1 Tax=Rhodoferax sp. TaxID=50421 RepID=UPI002775DA2B|nr:hypothetical protein [Rhodoferax sp.]
MPDQIDDAGEMMGQHSHASVDKRPVNGFRESACPKSAPNRRMCEKVDRAPEANVRKPRRTSPESRDEFDRHRRYLVSLNQTGAVEFDRR